MTRTLAARQVALIHGVFYLISGLWPIVHMRSFEAVSGKKTDRWLVKTVGGMICVVGAVLLAGCRDEIRGEHRGLAVGSAAWLGGVDVFYVLRRRISPVYLLDAVAEGALVALWLKSRTHARAPYDPVN